MTRARVHGQRGSVLMLVPAGVLVLIVLGAVAVDAAVAFLAQREVSDAAAAAANDAATYAIANRAFYAGVRPGTIAIDRDAALDATRQAVARRGMRGVTVTGLEVRVAGPRVCVSIDARVGYLFARAIPGVAHSTVVHGQAEATAVTGAAQAVEAGTSAC